ncbi:MAG: dihydroneopterin aldolase [Armatimonadota bacterium]|nr:dihydroneopterin aldolase [Armatimonadota bacterium]MDR7438673.1 dihydroneopterin aldolase [Armatimonadota bacterium]MDR7563770.1 dihydroneopterin aldolase [Armatimonadota bacterium]MDR7568900.1 dihydroneopterin aldolase [Armatimonadota bacterium]MDR7601810.1 dihydroneopterin aldolase [Armatimonadota bacterium]
MDRILLKDMAFYGFHGVRPEERERGQPFFVDVEVVCDLRPSGASDRLEDTLDYREIYGIVREVVEGPPRQLLEAVAEEIARRLLELERVQEVRVEVRKPHVRLGGALGYAAVRVERCRER